MPAQDVFVSLDMTRIEGVRQQNLVYLLLPVSCCLKILGCLQGSLPVADDNVDSSPPRMVIQGHLQKNQQSGWNSAYIDIE